MTDVHRSACPPPSPAAAGPAPGGAGSSRFRGAGNYVALIPFHAYVGLFLILPTLIVTGRRVHDGRRPVHARQLPVDVHDRRRSSTRSSSRIQLAVITAIARRRSSAACSRGRSSRGDPNGLLRQLVIAASGVLAQFGGVMLAFAFLATFGFNGLITLLIKTNLGVNAGHVVAVLADRASPWSTPTSRSR